MTNSYRKTDPKVVYDVICHPGGAATIPALASGRSFRVTLCFDDSLPAAFDTTTAAVANGQYQGGGIRIAPEAAIDDGLADATVVERVSLA